MVHFVGWVCGSQGCKVILVLLTQISDIPAYTTPTKTNYDYDQTLARVTPWIFYEQTKGIPP